MEPTTQTWDIGVNAHGQPIKLTKYRHNGRALFRIERGQADQRDDETYVLGLTVENLRTIAEAAK